LGRDPGPPREIQGRLYADGGIASNFFYGGPMDESDTFGATWRREHPNAPIPKTRYWVIINEYIEPVPVTVQPNWPAIVERSLYVSVRSAEAIALRHLYALAEATKLRGDGDVEVRWVAVPQTWRPFNDQFFDEPYAICRMRADASAPTPNRGTRRRRDWIAGVSIVVLLCCRAPPSRPHLWLAVPHRIDDLANGVYDELRRVGIDVVTAVRLCDQLGVE
jgi:hypothetical protein